MSVLNSYLDTIHLLLENNLRFTVTGTFAVFLQHPEFSEYYKIEDCDIFIPNTEEDLTAFVKFMKTNDWKTKIWEEEIDLAYIMQQAEGKYYIRCTKDDLVFDATYEHDKEVFGDPERDKVFVKNIPAISAVKILEGKMHRGKERDRMAVDAFGKISNFKL